MNQTLKAILPHVWVVLFFILISFIYCSPILQNKVPMQSDVIQAISGQRELVKYKKADGSTPLWTNSMFGGMPAYQVGGNMFQANIMGYVTRVFTTTFPNPVFLILLYLLGAYILFLVLDFEPIPAAAGAVAIAFSTYNFTIIDSGHINKALAIAFFAPIIAGILACFRGKYILGGLLTAFFLAWEIRSNHPQMTYYLFFSMLILGTVELYLSLKNKGWKNFLWASLSIVLGVILAVGINITSLMVNAEYAQESNRGNTELTLNKNEPKTGLSKDYAYAWSQGIGECATFLIPNAAGGASVGFEALDQNSETAKALSSHNNPLDDLSRLPLYWGPKSFTSGPYYFGALVFFFFILGLVMVKSPLKWWLLASTLLSIVLSWGKHFQGFSDFFFEHIPLYNKFRAVESILVIADLCVPILGFMALKQVLEKREKKVVVWNQVKWTFFGLGGLLVIMALIPTLFFDFVSANDAEAKFPEWLLTALKNDRAGLFRADAIRSLIFIGLGVGLIWLYLQNRIKLLYLYLFVGILVLIDMWAVDKRFFNDKKFVPKIQNEEAFLPSPQDEEILRDTSLDYRVYDAREGSPFLNARTSYFHKSIGGYHAAKLKRYDELIEFQLSRNNTQVFNMLNTKYFIVNDSAKGPVVRQNPNALGNAWFVSGVEFENSADQEMNALTGFDPKDRALINRSFQKEVNILKVNYDTASTVTLTNYRPDDLVYKYKTRVPGLIIFSEIYYPKGWHAYLDGKPAIFFRADYVLRGMQVPGGQHTVEFKFEPSIYYTGEKVSGISSTLLVLLIIGSIYFYYKKGSKVPGFIGLPNDDDFTGAPMPPENLSKMYKRAIEKPKSPMENISKDPKPAQESGTKESKKPKNLKPKPTNITPKKKGR